MADLAPTQPAPSPATDADGNLLLSRDEAQALLRECFAEFKTGLIALVHVSIETTNDLFDDNTFVSEAEVADFRSKRGQWIERFGQTLSDLFERRVVDTRRQGRRPDFDASLSTLRVLTTFDHEKQAALTTTTQFLDRLTKREIDAVDLRIEAMLGDPRPRDVDNPFSVYYALDAIGSSARALYPNPRVWRPLMERVLSDVTPRSTRATSRSTGSWPTTTCCPRSRRSSAREANFVRATTPTYCRRSAFVHAATLGCRGRVAGATSRFPPHRCLHPTALGSAAATPAQCGSRVCSHAVRRRPQPNPRLPRTANPSAPTPPRRSTPPSRR